MNFATCTLAVKYTKCPLEGGVGQRGEGFPHSACGGAPDSCPGIAPAWCTRTPFLTPSLNHFLA